jgi:hypothetical protein
MKFIERTPIRHCLPTPSSPKINGNDVDENMPMKDNNKSPNITNESLLATSTCPNTAVTTTSFGTQSPKLVTLSDDKVKIVIEMNNSNNPTDGKDGVYEDGQANGVGIFGFQ